MSYIDVHHHFLPDNYIKALEKIGVLQAGGMPFPSWNKQAMFETMERCAIKAAMLSLSSPGVYFGDAAFTIQLARQCNEYLAELVHQHPEKLGGLGVLPLPMVDAALNELCYLLDNLKLDGVALLSNYGEFYLGDSRLQPLFEELDRRRVVVFIHPTGPIGHSPKILSLPPSMVEFVADTTRTVTELLFSGMLEQFPHIAFILANAGGTIPYVAGRIELFERFKPELREKIPQGTATYLKRLYYETALATADSTLVSLLNFVPSNHILFGSDCPYAYAEAIEFEISGLENYKKCLTKKQFNDIEQNTALALFERFV